jgi:hypothetical protein
MQLYRLADNYSWQQKAEEYRVFAEGCDDELAHWGYLQLAQYCEAMAKRETRLAEYS